MGWVNYSATALILGTIAGYAINGRRTDAIRKAAAAAPEGPIPQALAAQIHDPWIFGTTHALTLMVMAIIWNMTTKPGDAKAAIVIVPRRAHRPGSAMPMVSRRQAILAGSGRVEPARSEWRGFVLAASPTRELRDAIAGPPLHGERPATYALSYATHSHLQSPKRRAMIREQRVDC